MITVVGSTAKGSPDSNTITSNPLDTTGANKLIALIADLTGSSTAMSSTPANTWDPLTVQSNSVNARFFVCEMPTVDAAQTFTATGTGTFPSIFVIALAGTKTSGSFDQQNGSIFTGTEINTGSVTPTEDNEIVIAGLGTNGSITAAIDSGFTIVQSLSNTGNNFAGAIAYLIQTTAGTVNPKWSGFSNVAAAVIATFRVADRRFVLIPS